MSETIDQAFLTEFQDDVHLAYQQFGSKLRNTVRLKTNVEGETCRFQVYGEGVASQKSRNGDVPVMNNVHTYKDATMADWYGADYVDKLDELKVNIDERQAAARSGAGALGRRIDSIIVAAARSSLPSAQKIAHGSAGLTKAKILSALELLNAADVPDDGERYALVGPHQWNELLNLAEFKSADYTGGFLPWTQGLEAKKWLNTVWIMSNQLVLSSGYRYCLWYHRSAIGLGETSDIITSIDWVAQKASYLIDNMMSAGSVRIDDEGVVEIACDDDASIS